MENGISLGSMLGVCCYSSGKSEREIKGKATVRANRVGDKYKKCEKFVCNGIFDWNIKERIHELLIA